MSVPVPPRRTDAWVCFCHNSPVFLNYYNGQSMKPECPVWLTGADLERIKDCEDDKWFVTTGGHLIENQGVWGDEEPPPLTTPQNRVASEDLTRYVHMYIFADNAIDQPFMNMDAGLYIDQPHIRIRLRHNYSQQYALDAPKRRVTDPHRYVEDQVRIYSWVHTWIGYIPRVAEVRKAEYEWLQKQAVQSFYKDAIKQSGLRQGVVELP